MLVTRVFICGHSVTCIFIFGSFFQCYTSIKIIGDPIQNKGIQLLFTESYKLKRENALLFQFSWLCNKLLHTTIYYLHRFCGSGIQTEHIRNGSSLLHNDQVPAGRNSMNTCSLTCLAVDAGSQPVRRYYKGYNFIYKNNKKDQKGTRNEKDVYEGNFKVLLWT